LLLAFAVALGLHAAFNLKGTFTAGMFAGALTNTPALAGVLEYIKNNAPQTLRDPLLAEPVIAYSLAYPIGVIGTLAAITVMQRVWKIDYAAEAQAHKELGGTRVLLDHRTVRVTQPEATGIPLVTLKRQHGWDVLVVRLKRAGHLSLTTGETRLQLDDDITVVGSEAEMDQFTAGVGMLSPQHIELDRSEFDFRRIFVSDHNVAGRRVRKLDLPERFEALITRIRRGDVDLLPHGDTVLELGDRVRVVARREQMGAVTRFFGDSYRDVSEVDILTFSLGLALGLLAGLIPIPLPGGTQLKLGLAGGPLLVALILGSVQRTGPFVWHVPYGANMTLRQVGLVLFLAGVGTRAGYAFFSTLAQGGGLALFVSGALITCLSAVALLWIGHRGLKIPMGVLIGMLAGMQTQPAVLGFANEQARNDLPNLGYATVYPLATIAKIILAQVLLTLLLPF
jgi:putative transport protein